MVHGVHYGSGLRCVYEQTSLEEKAMERDERRVLDTSSIRTEPEKVRIITGAQLVAGYVVLVGSIPTRRSYQVIWKRRDGTYLVEEPAVLNREARDA